MARSFNCCLDKVSRCPGIQVSFGRGLMGELLKTGGGMMRLASRTGTQAGSWYMPMQTICGIAHSKAMPFTLDLKDTA